MLKKMSLNKAFTLIEPGPVVLVTTHDRGRNNIMTISWTMVVDFTPKFAYFDNARKEKRMIHAVGDGTFRVDGRTLDRKKMMRSKIPDFF